MKFSRGRYRGIKPRSIMKIITSDDCAMLKKHVKFRKAQITGSVWNNVSAFNAGSNMVFEIVWAATPAP